MSLTFRWRGEFANAEVNALHAQGFSHRLLDDDWLAQVHRHSLGWVCARDDDELVGFVNVAWDGGVHAFVLDTVTAGSAQRRGIATQLVRVCVEEARTAGCEWLHVDFEEHLRDFYYGACGFVPTDGGLVQL